MEHQEIESIPEELIPVINTIARELYLIRGYKVSEDFDFFQAKHPQEKEALAGAIKSLTILNEFCLDYFGTDLSVLIKEE